MKRFCASRSIGRSRSEGATIQPSRQPVIEKYFEKLLITSASSAKAAAVVGVSSKVMP